MLAQSELGVRSVTPGLLKFPKMFSNKHLVSLGDLEQDNQHTDS